MMCEKKRFHGPEKKKIKKKIVATGCNSHFVRYSNIEYGAIVMHFIPMITGDQG